MPPAGVHYIPVRRDFSNVEEAIAAFRDEALCARLADAAYEVAATQLTYPKLIDRFSEALAGLV